MTRLTVLAIAVSAAVLPAAVVPVSIIDFDYTPETTDVVVGDSVVWTNGGVFTHTSTSGAGGVPDGVWNSGLLAPGAVFGRVFSSAGDFPYFCAPHYPVNQMAGMIRVRSTGVEQDGGRFVAARLLARPNPFRASTVLRVSDGRAGLTRFLVTDAAGGKVRVLEGPGRVVWDGRDESGRPVLAGVYFAQAGNGAVVRLLKID